MSSINPRTTDCLSSFSGLQSALHTRHRHRDINGGSCHRFCRDKSLVCREKTRLFFLDKTRLFSRQKCACRNNTFVATNIFLSRQTFCRATNIITFVGSKTSFVATKHVLVARNICRDKTILSRKAYFCRDRKHTFVATKIVLVAVPANDTGYHHPISGSGVGPQSSFGVSEDGASPVTASSLSSLRFVPLL